MLVKESLAPVRSKLAVLDTFPPYPVPSGAPPAAALKACRPSPSKANKPPPLPLPMKLSEVIVLPELLMMPTRLSSEPSYGFGLGRAVEKEPPGPAVMTTLHVVTPLMLGQGTAFADPPATAPTLRIALAIK